MATARGALEFRAAKPGAKLAPERGSMHHKLVLAAAVAASAGCGAAVPTTGPSPAPDAACVWTGDSSRTPHLLKDINVGPGSSELWAPIAVGACRVFFAANDGLRGRELWASDGTEAGTVLVKDIRLGSAQSDPVALRMVGRRLFFDADDGVHGRELWTSDGTEGGTRLVRDISPGSKDSRLRDLVERRGMLFFLAGTGDDTTLWRSGGTEAGTQPVGTFPGGVSLRDVNGTLFLFAKSADGTYALFKGDGTPNGMSAVLERMTAPEVVVSAASSLFFFLRLPSDGAELWKVDADGTGARRLAIFPRDRPTEIGGTNAVGVNGQLYFSVDDRPSFVGTGHGRELWASDGTPEGTRMVGDLVPGADASEPRTLTARADALFFIAWTGSPWWRSPHGLWRTDGTAGGTVLVHSFPKSVSMTTAGSLLVLSGTDTEHGRELWTSDGTPEGTRLVDDILPGTGDSSPGNLTSAGPFVFFSATDGVRGFEPWVWRRP